MKQFTRSSVLLSVLGAAIGAALLASTAAGTVAASYPSQIDFPAPQFDGAGTFIAGTGYSPEGIAISGNSFYAPSTATGEIIKGDLSTGTYTRNWVPASPNQPSDLHRGVLGVLVDSHNRLWAAASYGMSCTASTPCPPGVTAPFTNYGAALVYDATTGDLLAQYTLTVAASKLINDMTISGDAVYFSNTTAPSGAGSEVQFKLQLGPGGALPPGDTPPAAPGRATVNPAVTNLPTPGFTSADGIDTLPNGNIILNSVGGTSNGGMIVLDATTGAVTPIVVTAAATCITGTCAPPLLSGDGIAIDGDTLYYPENRSNTATPPGDIAMIHLIPPDYTHAEIVARLNAPAGQVALRSPANTEQLGHSVYVITRRQINNPVTGVLLTTPVQTFIQAITKPTVAATGTPVSASEGSVFSGAVASGTDSSGLTGKSASINWGDGSPPGPGTVTGTGSFTVSGAHSYAQDGSYTVTTTIKDAVTSVVLATTTSTATVSNTAPSVTIDTPAGGASYEFADPVHLHASFTDPGVLDTHSCSIDWGDGASSAGVVSEAAGSGTCTGTHTFSSTGPKTISVTVTDDASGSGSASVTVGVPLAAIAFHVHVVDGGSSDVAGAPVDICPAAAQACSAAASTDATGVVVVHGVPTGSAALVRAFPPAGSSLLPAEQTVPQAAIDAAVTAGTPVSVTLTLLAVTSPPPGTGISPTGGHPGPGGAPSVYMFSPTTITTTGCANATVTYMVTFADGPPNVTGSMTETPGGSGVYSATLAPFAPHHGAATVSMHIVCPDSSTSDPAFSIYIDPSGVVRTVGGAPIPGATVTLYRFDSGLGTFVQVPNGDPIMAPSNRMNPDLTDVSGHFGWDVISGDYVVRAAKAGCISPDHSTAYTESPVLTIPPAVIDLDLRLDCGPVTHFSVTASPTALYSGQTLTLKAVALDSGGARVTTYSASPTISSHTVAPTQMTCNKGNCIAVVTVSGASAGDVATVSDGKAGGSSNAFRVWGPIAYFRVSVNPVSVARCAPLHIGVTAFDGASQVIPNYQGDLTVTDTAGGVSSFVSKQWAAGQIVFDVLPTRVAAKDVIRVVDGSGASGTGGTIFSVTAGKCALS